MLFTRLTFTILLTIVANADLHAWGNEGHKVACRIAYNLLSPTQREEVDRLRNSYRSPDGYQFKSFAQTCTLADFGRVKAKTGDRDWQRFGRFNDWHFMNVPRNTRSINALHCHGNCVLSAIQWHYQRFANRKLDDRDRAEALFMLAHWIADVHQPLHVSYKDDRGGNLVRVTGRSLPGSRNLHALWDSGLVGVLLGSDKWWRYSEDLGNKMSSQHQRSWSASIPLDWAKESYAITTSPDTHYCRWKSGNRGLLCAPIKGSRFLTARYLTKNDEIAERRLQQAGVRIASWIRKGL